MPVDHIADVDGSVAAVDGGNIHGSDGAGCATIPSLAVHKEAARRR